jgi:hypothetical protein
MSMISRTESVPETLRVHQKLLSAGVAISGTGWETLADNGGRSLSGTFDSKGGTLLTVDLFGSATVALGNANTRVIIAGGSFGVGVVITPDPASTMLVPGTVRIAQHNSVEIPATETLTTYTVTAQGEGSGVLVTITPNAGTNLDAHEHP